jgi:hypothetical protein
MSDLVLLPVVGEQHQTKRVRLAHSKVVLVAVGTIPLLPVMELPVLVTLVALEQLARIIPAVVAAVLALLVLRQLPPLRVMVVQALLTHCRLDRRRLTVAVVVVEHTAAVRLERVVLVEAATAAHRAETMLVLMGPLILAVAVEGHQA